MKLLLSVLVGLVLIVGAPNHHAHALTKNDILGQLEEPLKNDLQLLAVNTPVWLAQHLPAMMNQSGLGAGIDLSGKSGGITFGIIPVHIGLMNRFDALGHGLQVLRLEETLPSNLAWPQMGVTLGIGLGNGVEIGADVRFIPKTNFAFVSDIDVEVGLLSVSTSLRWRINQAKGAMPAFVLGIGGAYASGTMGLGVGHKGAYTLPTAAGGSAVGLPASLTGTYSFEGSPLMSWEIFQISAELRVGWKLGVVRPYIGFGFGYNLGDIRGELAFNVRLTSDQLDLGDHAESYLEESYSTSPAQFTLRPQLGLDIVLGIVAITLQVELAVMAQEKLSEVVTGAAKQVDLSNGNYLFNDASRETSISAALVSTLAVRLQF